MSPEAQLAMAKGASQMCPGCLFEKVIPDNDQGGANHTMPSGSKYECHANTEAWQDVPEWLEKREDDLS